MAKSPDSYYWDTCVFLMVLQGEDYHGEGVLDGAVHVLRRVEIGQVTLISSQITVVEIMRHRLTPDQFERWEAWQQLPNLVLRGVDYGIAVRARELRDQGRRLKPCALNIGLPDALHAATALAYKPTAIHSLDNRLNNIFRHLEIEMEAKKPYLAPPAQNRLPMLDLDSTRRFNL